jgi:dihydrofolate reductase
MEAILAIDNKNGLSKNGVIPWKSKKDMNFFSQKTKNNIIFMGKNTYFSLPSQNRPLKNRLNIVLTKEPDTYLFNENYKKYKELLFTNDINICKILIQDIHLYTGIYPSLNRNSKIYIIGGKQIYEQYIPLCETVWVTYIKKDYECDLFFEYDFLKLFKEKVFYEDAELKIIQYCKF